MTGPALWGCAGGGAGALAGHAAVIWLERRTGHANAWLKGPHGPPFFDLTLATALYYGFLGAFLASGWRRLQALGVGFLSAFLFLASPLVLATRCFAWGEKATDPATLAWVYLVLGAYSAANLGAPAAIARVSLRSASGRSAAGAAAGAAAAFLLQYVGRRLLPDLGGGLEPLGLLAPPSAVFSGVFWGASIGAGAAAAGGCHEA